MAIVVGLTLQFLEIQIGKLIQTEVKIVITPIMGFNKMAIANPSSKVRSKIFLSSIGFIIVNPPFVKIVQLPRICRIGCLVARYTKMRAHKKKT